MSGKVWGEITYPFWNFNGATAEICEWINDSIWHINSLRPSDAYMRQ